MTVFAAIAVALLVSSVVIVRTLTIPRRLEKAQKKADTEQQARAGYTGRKKAK